MKRTIIASLMGLGMVLPFPAGATQLPGVAMDVSVEYRAQSATRLNGSDDEDQDLSIGLGVEVPSVAGKRLSFSGFVAYDKDLDGTAEDSVYKDSLDSYSRRDDWQLYRAAITYRVAEDWLRVVVGRQEVWSAETVTLDGGRVELAPCRWASLEVYGGRRVSFYRDPDPLAVYGGDLVLRPWRGGTLALRDLYYIENSLELSAAQQLWGLGSARVAYRRIGSDTRDASASLALYPWAGGELYLSYLRVFNDYQYDYTSHDDDWVENLHFPEQEPYADYSFTARQQFFGVAGVGVRLRRHNVIEDGDEDTYNVDFNEGALLLDLERWPWPGLRLDAELTRWVEDRERDDLGEDSLWGYLLRAEQNFWGSAVGASYHRQTYDSDGAPRDAIGYDLWLRWRLLEGRELLLRYERAEDDLYRQEGIDALKVFTARLDLAF